MEFKNIISLQTYFFSFTLRKVHDIQDLFLFPVEAMRPVAVLSVEKGQTGVMEPAPGSKGLVLHLQVQKNSQTETACIWKSRPPSNFKHSGF